MSTSPIPRLYGRLNLHFVRARDEQVTTLLAREQEPPLRVVRAFSQADGGTLVHLHNLSGGVLGGDRLALSLDLAPAARAQVTTTGATRVYRCRPGVPSARQDITVHVGAGALLEYLPDPLIPFAGARYEQVTRIELAEDAGLFWWETLAPGRLAHGECFAYDLLRLEMSIDADGQPIARERFLLEPRCADLASAVRLGTFVYQTSFFVCRVGLPAPRWRQLEQELSELVQRLTQPGEIVWGVSALVAHGLLVRGLSRGSTAIAHGLLAFWRAAKRALYNAEIDPPRKVL